MSTLVAVELVHIECASYCMTFGVPARFEKDRRRDHKTFFCPSGHRNVYYGKTDLEKAREEAERLRREAEYHAKRATDWMEAADRKGRQLAATKGHLTRAKRRIAAGECPCCRSEFPDLRAHMEAAHPDYATTPEQS